MSVQHFENPYSLTPSEIPGAVAQLAKAFFKQGIYIPAMLWGDAGVGKTQGVQQAAKLINADVVVRHPAQEEPTEIVGVKWVVNSEVMTLPPGEIPIGADKPTILFFDEVPQASMMVKNVLCPVILDRTVGTHPLGPNVYVCAAGNYPRNRAGTTPMPTQLNARLTHYDVVPDHVGWLDMAARRGAHQFVTAFVRRVPHALHEPDPDQRVSPNPRAWMRVSDIEKAGITGQGRLAAIIGTLGPKVGGDYISITSILDTMPDPADVIANPKTAPVPTDRAIIYVLCSSLAALAKPANIGAIITYTDRLVGDEEYQVMCLSEARARNPLIDTAKAMRDYFLSPRGQVLSA